ncbi:MAG: hypothetical protein JF595_11360 [Sphingomonadales bacterium]|nr:hypothetical protein [Sphingomonadales bacterium]
MRSLRAIPLVLVLAAALSACSSTGTKPRADTTAPRKPVVVRQNKPRQPVRPPITRPPPAAQVQQLPGLEGVIGRTAAELTRQFGTARLDVWEGDARKLQFTGIPCVLDVYLYPGSQGREPQATYVDARRSDGRDVDRAACIQALRKP